MRLFFVAFFVGISFLVPAHKAQANPLSDMFGAVVDAYLGSSSDSVGATNNTSSGEKNSQTMNLAAAALNSDLNQESGDDESVGEVEGSAVSALRTVTPTATNADKPKINTYGDQISVYVVHNGDTLSEVAKMFNVSANTIRWSNNIPKGGGLKVGQQLVILPVSGVQYTIKKGDTVNKIAKTYSADAGEIRDFNDIDDSSMSVGDVIIIPNGEVTPTPVLTPIKKFIANILSPESPSASSNGYFIRPAKGGETQGLHGHNGVDLSARGGLAVVAAASGKVMVSLDSGYNGGYGHYIVIQHPNGMQTLYGHLSANFVSAGDMVSQGQLIGNIGNTGRSTGPHLHFEVRGGVNPF